MSAATDAASLPPAPRLLAVIGLDDRGAEVARHALRLARERGGSVVVAHVVDHMPGLETDHWPFLTSVEMEAELAVSARRRLDRLMDRHGLGGQRRITTGHPARTIAHLAASLRSDAIVVGSHANSLPPHAAPRIIEAPTGRGGVAGFVQALWRSAWTGRHLGEQATGGLELAGLGEGDGGKHPG
ncbi:MAG: universal stress protein [Alphaproteobacteria bacterium]|nr:universal stress protein [Alphaproteobacteria bacterium]